MEPPDSLQSSYPGGSSGSSREPPAGIPDCITADGSHSLSYHRDLLGASRARERAVASDADAAPAARRTGRRVRGGGRPAASSVALAVPASACDARDALDLAAVTRLATAEGCEVVHFSREARLVSFAPGPGAATRGGNGRERRATIHVYWSAGTVGVSYRDPSRGKVVQAFRRRAAWPDVVAIFQNPWLGYADAREAGAEDASLPGGDGGDDVVLLQETNRRLREKIDDLARTRHRIEITGRRGDPVLATGAFETGRWEVQHGGARLWSVDLVLDGASDAIAVPLSALEDLEVRLGGVLYASACSHEVRVRLDGHSEWDGETRKEVSCHFGGPVTGVRLQVRVDGWARRHWEGVARKDAARRRNEHRANLNMYDVLVEEVPERCPGATATFVRASFCGECVEQLARRSQRGAAAAVAAAARRPEDNGAAGQEEEEMWSLATRAVAELRRAGCDDVGEAFMRRVNDLQVAVHLLLAVREGEEPADAPPVAAEVPALAELQLASRSTTGFLSDVRRRYGVLAGLSGASD